jgi:hypothetical protein
MPEPSPTHVYTGADDDGRRRVLHLAVGLLGWLLWAGLIVWLALHASADALDVATFLATVVVTVALLTVLTALALRPAVMRRRALQPAIEAAAATPPAAGAALDGEIVVQLVGSERRYAPAREPGA